VIGSSAIWGVGGEGLFCGGGVDRVGGWIRCHKVSSANAKSVACNVALGGVCVVCGGGLWGKSSR
jgi:hypothetical protein